MVHTWFSNTFQWTSLISLEACRNGSKRRSRLFCLMAACDHANVLYIIAVGQTAPVTRHAVKGLFSCNELCHESGGIKRQVGL